jgi:hypothetical protein
MKKHRHLNKGLSLVAVLAAEAARAPRELCHEAPPQVIPTRERELFIVFRGVIVFPANRWEHSLGGGEYMAAVLVMIAFSLDMRQSSLLTTFWSEST